MLEEVLTTKEELAARRERYVTIATAYIEKGTGKSVKDCTSVELITVGPATNGLMARAAYNRVLSKVLKTEKAQAIQDASFAERVLDAQPI